MDENQVKTVVLDKHIWHAINERRNKQAAESPAELDLSKPTEDFDPDQDFEQ